MIGPVFVAALRQDGFDPLNSPGAGHVIHAAARAREEVTGWSLLSATCTSGRPLPSNVLRMRAPLSHG
jgi:hypothetical protein